MNKQQLTIMIILHNIIIHDSIKENYFYTNIYESNTLLFLELIKYIQ